MKNSLRQFESISSEANSRRGFTLVELLVAIGILVILTTLTVSAFTLNDGDRVSNSISTFKNALEGARSRAVADGQVRGLRLILDENDPRIVKSMIYVGASDYHTRGTVQAVWNTAGFWEIEFDSAGLNNLKDIGAFDDTVGGYRIEVPAGSGNWFTLRNNLGPINRWRIIEHFEPSSWNTTLAGWSPAPTLTATPARTEELPYRLELKPTILEGEDPILLDPLTCIDLDGSRVPESWRAREDTNRDGTLDTMGSEPDANGNGLFDFSAGYAQGSNRMDILFSPDGTLAGNLKSEGVINFRIAYVSDVILALPLRQRALTYDYSGIATYPDFILPADPEKDHKALTIFTQTGSIIITDIDPTISGSLTNGFNNDIATQPYYYARLGRESN
ncbi:pilus assembly FimT family protein [Thalassoglobus sp.]|uniref:pilus assembly FimT family protein n=1 Tax=Thalassoglobus sp. TaxID=2795869 RepID=UPI003AA7C1FD